MLRWDVDDRPRRLWTRIYMKGMWARRDKDAFEGEQHTLEQARDEQRHGDAPPTLLTRALVQVTEEDHDGMVVWRARPRRGRPRARVVYVHGGGYVHPLTPDYWRLVRALVRSPAEVVVPAYPLAPGATADEVLTRLTALVRETAEGGLPTVLMGDSAGGALVLVLARRTAGDPTPPARVVALSPWLDATLAVREEQVRDHEPSDPMLAESGLRAAGRAYAGDRDPADPEVSPVHLDLDGLPPVDVFIGDRDILRPAVDVLAERAREARVDMHVHEVTAMFHVWMTRAIPEARRTRKVLVELVRRAG
ncbi:alpha/beta hydrolase fold domain-containing protein [Nocardioides sp. SYSU DS0651]|uniref:alpha/beta hydrolase fold domain-containing protein n=1 Tax=Nocardioides sp. SYSU DS0651 TaxID=3415955 RepID=UPI003F4B11F3